MSAADVAPNYMKNTTVLTLGGLTVAVAVEVSNLHKRIAIGIIKIIGTSQRKLMFGFILLSWFLSMWIANVAASSMTIPIAVAVLEELKMNEGVENDAFDATSDTCENEPKDEEETSFEQFEKKPKKVELSKIEKGLVISVPYGCSIGGTATLTGTAPNMILSELWQEKYPNAPIQLNFTHELLLI